MLHYNHILSISRCMRSAVSLSTSLLCNSNSICKTVNDQNIQCRYNMYKMVSQCRHVHRLGVKCTVNNCVFICLACGEPCTIFCGEVVDFIVA